MLELCGNIILVLFLNNSFPHTIKLSVVISYALHVCSEHLFISVSQLLIFLRV